MTPLTRLLSSTFVGLTLVGVLCATACVTPNRRMDEDQITESASAESAPNNTVQANALTPEPVNKPLPPPTMTAKEIRTELWKIDADRKRGEAGKAIAEYADRANATHALEARFLAAAAIADDDEAWKAYFAVAQEYPKFYWAHAGMAMVYSRWKVRDQCEREVNTMLEIDPENLFAYTIRGNLYRNLGEFQLAIRDYTTALRADASDADARVGLAIAKRTLGQTVDFQEQMDTALQDVPTHYEAAEQEALVLDEANDKAGATKAWERVEALAPKNRAAHLALARLRGDSDPDAAIKAYERASKESPLSKAEQESLTKLYRQQNRTEDELKSLDVLSKLDPKDPVPLERIAEIADGKGDLPTAENAYQAILKVSDTNPNALLGLGRIAEKRSQLKDAVILYRKARAAGSTAGGKEAARLAEQCALGEKPLTARDLNSYYGVIANSLAKAFERRLVDVPRLKGQMKVKIELDDKGKVQTASITENTLNDGCLEAHLYFTVADSFPPKLKANDPRKFTLTFDLPPETKTASDAQ
jgi:tetratricopeptide (TPR) repeat protein